MSFCRFSTHHAGRRTSKWAMAVATVVALVTFAGTASAQSSPKIYFTEFVSYKSQADAVAVEQITRTTRDRLSVDPTIQIAAQISSGSGEKVVSPAITEATRLYENGRGLYVDQQFDNAVSSFIESLSFLDTNVADIEDWKMIEALLLRLSVSLHESGDSAGAEDAIRRLVSFNPDLILVASETLSEGYIKTYDATRTKAQKRGPGSLDTSAVAPGAEIWIDGTIRGASPMTVKDIAAGSHFIILKQGDAKWGGLVTVEPKGTTNLTAELKSETQTNPETDLRTALDSGVIGDSVNLAIRNLANRSATSFVVAAVVLPTDKHYVVETFIYTTELSTLRRLEPVKFDKDLLKIQVDSYNLAKSIIDSVFDTGKGTAVSATVTLDPKDHEEAVVAAVTATNQGDGTGNTGDTTRDGSGDGGEVITGIPNDEESWYENPWLWTGIGLGVAAIAGGTVAAVLLLDEGDTKATSFNATIEW